MIITDMKRLGQLVRHRRRELGWTQQQLADAAGVSRPWVSEFEHGKATAEMRLGFALLHALRLTVTVNPTDRSEAEADPIGRATALKWTPAQKPGPERPGLTRNGKSIGLARASSSFDFETPE